MEAQRVVAVFKSYGWVVNLLVIAAGTYCVAGVANTLLARTIRVVPRPDDEPLRFRTPRLGQRSPGSATYTRISERNLFGAKKDPEIDPDAEVDSDEGNGALTGSDYSEDDLKNCTMAATLRATLVAQDRPEWSMAVFYDNTSREPKVFTVNAGSNEIAPDATLVEIRSRAAVIRRTDHFELCSADKDRPAVATPRSVVSTISPSSDSSGDEVRKTGDNDYQVAREYIDDTMGNLSRVATQARIVPSFRNGKSNGFKLFSIKPGSIYQKIGLQNGDVIQKVNGFTIDSPDKALEIYSKLKTSRDVNIELLRRGQPVSKNYSIR